MSDDFWLRAYRLTITPPGESGRQFSELRCSFTISKTMRSSHNTASIYLYNLAPGTRKMMQAEDTLVQVEAGYQDRLSTIFDGSVVTSRSALEGPNWVTSAECGEGVKALRDSRLQRTWKEGTPRGRIVRDLLEAIQLTAIGRVETASLTGRISAPLSVSGQVRRSLDRLANQWGFQWSVQAGVAEVRDRGTGAGKETVALLRPDSGLLGTPEWTEEGLKFRALLTAQVTPGKRVEIQSDIVSGVFQVERADYVGDTHGIDWSVSAISVEAAG